MKMLIGLAWLLVLLSPSFAAPQALKEVRLGSTDITVSNFSSFYARDRKFFETEGLDMKMVIIKTEAALAAMASGDLDYSTLSTSSVEGTLKGMPLRLLAVTNRYPLLGLVVRKGINSVADLKGKKLSVSSFGGAVYGAALYLLRSHGLRPKEDVAILAGGTNPARIATLKQGLVDAALITAPDDLRALGEGYRILVDVGSDYRLPWGGISTSQNKIRRNPGETERFLRAVMRGVRAITDPQNQADYRQRGGKRADRQSARSGRGGGLFDCKTAALLATCVHPRRVSAGKELLDGVVSIVLILWLASLPVRAEAQTGAATEKVRIA